ncbi:MAG TPA: NAD(P)-dependent oxidoreductase [Dehalococcoidia bacterium]|nr:NAD(P)-dependent oxidoreductase [Dehalococcoidia bacterium]
MIQVLNAITVLTTENRGGIAVKVGFIGVGFMGRHMARNIIKGGHDLTVFDINKDAAEELLSLGATWAASPRAAAQASEVVFTSLPRPQDVEEVTTGEGGLMSGMSSGTAYFDLSTTDPSTIKRIAEAGNARGVQVLDAPVSGGTGGAEAATLCVMVGGDKDTYDKFKPVLDLIGDKAMYCGGLGSGAVSKIVNNLIGLSVGVLLSEAFTMGIKAGVDAQTLFEAVSGSSGNTTSMRSFPNGIFQRNFDPGFQVDLAAKDVGLATQLGRDLRVPMEMSNIAQQRYIDAQNKGWGRLAAGAVARVQEERSGVEIKPNE